MSEQLEQDPTRPPTGALEYRAATLTGVSFPERTLELVVMPYETEAVVPFQGRMVREVVSAGAFDGIERRANRVRVNRDHDVTRTVGRAIRFWPSREEGLVAEVRIAQTQLGDETLQLADEGILDASAGFLPMPGGETWTGRALRRLTKVWLGHIAMTPDPAFETARVLAVRSAEQGEEVATPNLDQVRAWLYESRSEGQRETRYSQIDR
jgi:HK97 family phage prohead protease